MACLIQIAFIIIAFAINPIFGLLWLLAQILGGLNDNFYDDDGK